MSMSLILGEKKKMKKKLHCHQCCRIINKKVKVNIYITQDYIVEKLVNT